MNIICILDYCKTKACLIGVIPSMEILLFHANVIYCWSLGTYLYKEWILRWGKWSILCEGYLWWNLCKMSQSLSEIHEKYIKIVKRANLVGFLNRLVFPSILTDSQPLDTKYWWYLILSDGFTMLCTLVWTFWMCTESLFTEFSRWQLTSVMLILSQKN